MNNSDFLSDAVALDLGKSGVKVAETLEIEVGEEWWRLINAAVGGNLNIFEGRDFPDPIIDGGVIYLGAVDTARGYASQHWDVSANYGKLNPQVILPPGGQIEDATFLVMSSYPYPYLEVFDITGASVWKKAMPLQDSRTGGCYYDAQNDCVVYGIPYSGGYYRLSPATGATISGVSRSVTYTATPARVGTFPETNDRVFSAWVSGSTGTIRTTGLSAGQDLTTEGDSVFVTQTGTVFSTNVNSGSSVFLFYSRALGSAGVAWIDATSKRINYALETESWGTAHVLADIAPGVADLRGFGSLVIPGEGEFLCAQYDQAEIGNLGFETGYSLPANFVWMGGSPIGGGLWRCFGRVGTTLYAYTLDISTSELSYHGVASSSWNYAPVYGRSEFSPVVIAQNETSELIVFTNTKNSASAIFGNWEIFSFLALYSKTSNTIVWVSALHTDAQVFPYSKQQGTSHYDNTATCCHHLRHGDNLLIFSMTCKGTDAAEIYSIPISTIMGCVDAAAVKAAILASGRHTTLLQNLAANTPLLSSNLAYPLKSLIEDQDFLYLSLGFASSTGSYYRYIARISKTDYSVTLTSTNRGPAFADEIWATGVQSTGDDDDLDYIGDASGTPGQDGKFRHRISASTTTPYGVLTQVGVNAATTTGAPVTYTSTVPLIQGLCYSMTDIPAIGAEHQALAYMVDHLISTNTGKYLKIMAAYGSGANNYGDYKSIYMGFVGTQIRADERSDVAYVFGQPSGGLIPYCKIRGIKGDLGPVKAVSMTDGAVYDVDTGEYDAGGVLGFTPAGSYVFYKSVAGEVCVKTTGATLTEGDVGGETAPTGNYVMNYRDRTFIPYPFAREGIRAELSNISKTTKITMPETQDNLIRGMLAAGTDFRGSRCILRRVFPDHMDEAGSDIVLLDGYIQDWSYVPGKKGIAFSVSKTLIDVGGQFPKRLMNMGCSHVFKGARCQYLGETGRCLKTKTFCTSLANQLQFGGFPWIAARQRRVMWK